MIFWILRSDPLYTIDLANICIVDPKYFDLKCKKPGKKTLALPGGRSNREVVGGGSIDPVGGR